MQNTAEAEAVVVSIMMFLLTLLLTCPSGEGQLMSWDEHVMLIAHTVNSFGSHLQVIGNTGSNSTREALHATEQGFAVGMDAALQINPYYGKTSLDGLIAHFSAVLDEGPTIVYNVPSRTGIHAHLRCLTCIPVSYACNPGIVLHAHASHACLRTYRSVIVTSIICKAGIPFSLLALTGLLRTCLPRLHLPAATHVCRPGCA